MYLSVICVCVLAACVWCLSGETNNFLEVLYWSYEASTLYACCFSNAIGLLKLMYLLHLWGCVLVPGDDTMTGDGGEYLRAEDLKELGDDSLPSSQFLDGMNYLRYSLEGGRSDRYFFTLPW